MQLLLLGFNESLRIILGFYKEVVNVSFNYLVRTCWIKINSRNLRCSLLDLVLNYDMLDAQSLEI